jgi:hypothetical protein
LVENDGLAILILLKIQSTPYGDIRYQGLGGDLYSNVHNSQIDLARRHMFQGRYKSSANSLQLGAVSSFYLQPGTIIQQCYVFGQMAMPQHARASDGWMYDAIQQLEIIVAGSSSIQSLRLSGRSHLDMVLAFTSSQEKRNQLLQCCPAFNLTSAGANVQGGVLICMPWSHPELNGAFAWDTSTIKSQIIINVTWKFGYQFLSGSTGNAITAPTAWSDLYLRVNNQVELQDQFLMNSMARNPSLCYSIPNLYCQTFQTPVTLTSGVEQQIALTSMPSAGLECILVSAVPSSWVGASDTVSNYSNSVVGIPFKTLRMLFNGQELVRFDYQLEDKLQSCLKNDRTSCDYNVLNTASVAAAATNVLYQNRVHIIPFSNEISKVLRERRMENVQSYSGSTLQLFITPADLGLPYVTDAVPITPAYLAVPSAVTYSLNVTFVCNSLIEVQDFSVSQQLD